MKTFIVCDSLPIFTDDFYLESFILEVSQSFEKPFGPNSFF